MTSGEQATPRTPRERARAQTMADITRIGRAHLIEHGADGLSLRAVARDLGVVSSAVYRYVRSRDELLTMLVVDGYNELGEAVEQAVRTVPDTDFAGQFRALGWAVRDWARREPARYGLLFGTPVPGYQAPAEQTTGPGTRVIVALIGIIERAYRAGSISPREAPTPATGLVADCARIADEFGLSAPATVLTRGMFAWASLFGIVTFEVFDQYGPGTLTDPTELFAHHLDVLVETMGLGG
ncbi:TetR/AcrR family transcriptional regulator [Skermania sp. ID1734]|uniref:TetR/AcrR family transcriptional regulator n=1 Tax=Skermania sp. ID1734 TaxID=2597516 RepID=UPI00117E933C|nr:TetR/AcrR family transcriptional regulator [Skermania sp. ID1734]TSD99280.1 TetR/AcrR family transcriptional regulator [Skermania sp. ID1734]